MDFVKAFDKVSHWRFILKLRRYDVTGSVNQWFEDFLSERTQGVVCSGKHSDWKPVKSGIPQGSAIGPILFLIYINDLPEEVKANVRLFADGTIIHMTMTSENDASSLQQDLHRLASWEKKWQMQFQPQKCSISLFSEANLQIFSSTIFMATFFSQKQIASVTINITISNKLSLEQPYKQCV